jgi:hypothetical protein
MIITYERFMQFPAKQQKYAAGAWYEKMAGYPKVVRPLRDQKGPALNYPISDLHMTIKVFNFVYLRVLAIEPYPWNCFPYTGRDTLK